MGPKDTSPFPLRPGSRPLAQDTQKPQPRQGGFPGRPCSPDAQTFPSQPARVPSDPQPGLQTKSTNGYSVHVPVSSGRHTRHDISRMKALSFPVSLSLLFRYQASSATCDSPPVTAHTRARPPSFSLANLSSGPWGHTLCLEPSSPDPLSIHLLLLLWASRVCHFSGEVLCDPQAGACPRDLDPPPDLWVGRPDLSCSAPGPRTWQGVQSRSVQIFTE